MVDHDDVGRLLDEPIHPPLAAGRDVYLVAST
jgi:hypothetical protein